jgi:adenylate cyclase
MQRRLAAILAADMVGFSSMMEQNEEATFELVSTIREHVIQKQLDKNQGRLIKTTGDGFLAEFASPLAALRCARSIQQEISDKHQPFRLRIGLNLGDVIIDQSGDTYGEGVNIAARLESICDPGGILLSSKIYDEVAGKIDILFEDRGEQALKNIVKPVRIYAVSVGSRTADGAGTSSDKPSIAVLPFDNMSRDPDQDFFADGITEDIITELSRSKGLLVIARNSTFTYKGKSVDVKKVGRELSVKYVLEGSVRRSGQRVRVTAQLINAQTGGHVWAERYDRELLDIFEVQDEITRTVVATLQTELITLEGSLADRLGLPDFAVWTASKIVWQQFYHLNKEHVLESRRLAQEMAQQFPTSPEGYKLLSLTTSHCVFMGFSPDPAVWKEQAEEAIRKAVSLSTNDEHIYWGLGIVLGILRDQFEEAIAALERSIQINPNFALGYGTSGTVMAYAGRPHDSISKTEYAIRLNPRDPSIFFRHSVLAISYFLLGEYDEAIKWARLSMDRSEYWVPHAIVVASLNLLGKNVEAKSAAKSLLQVFPAFALQSLPIQPIRPIGPKKAFYDALEKAGLPT